jgi:replication factor C small subunit
LVAVSEGDCRKLENLLQASSVMGKEIDEDTIYSIASSARPKEVIEVLKLALDNKFIDARNKLLDTMLNHGLSGLDIIKQIQKELFNLPISGRTQLELVSKCGEAEFRISEGSDEYVQLEAFLADVALAGDKENHK